MGIFFSIISPAIFGINNYIDKFILEKRAVSPATINIYIAIASFLAVIILLPFTGYQRIDIQSLAILLSSGFLTTIYLLPYYKALALDETSRVVPLFQFYPIFVLCLSFIFLKEGFSPAQYAGSLLIIGGGFLLAIEKLDKKIFKLRKSFFYMILSSLLFAAAQVLYKFGVEEIPFWNTLLYEGTGIMIGAIAMLCYKNTFKQFMKETRKFKKNAFFLLMLNGMISTAAKYSGYFALSLLSVGLVSILGILQPVFVLIYGIILSLWFPHILKEIINKKIVTQKLASLVLMFFGLYFIFS